MDNIIADPASCEVHAEPHFLYAEGQSVAENSFRLCRVYDDYILNDSCVREWCRKFRDERTDVHDEGGQVRHSIVTDELIPNSGNFVKRNHGTREHNNVRGLL
jgi:hypothetical protein